MFSLRTNRRIFAFAHDVLASVVAFLLAVYLRLGTDVFANIEPTLLAQDTAAFALTCAIVFLISGLYKGIWAFSSIRDLRGVIQAASVAVALYVIAGFFIFRLEGVPRTAPLIAWTLLILILGGSRMALRVLREHRLGALFDKTSVPRTNILVVGAGDETEIFLRALAANPQAPYRAVGIIGLNDHRTGRQIHGVDVLGSLDHLSEIVSKLRDNDTEVSRLILPRSFTRLNGKVVTDLLDKAPSLGLTLSRLPSLTELQDNVTASLKDKPIALEDLLGRPEIKLNREEISRLVQGRRVLITGAGGSIGSELVRQIAALSPSCITIVDICEFNLYKIGMEITQTFPDVPFHPYIGDVRDAPRMSSLFREEKPELVFHAAAIKHVPIAEQNAREALLTNVVGTRIIADCAAKIGVLLMVQISTDKAVNPTNVMGATKRLAEMYCQALDLASPSSRFITVRFGNVLGSTGSVVPLFKSQLEKGGPLTVTHPDITRYFMTIREAVELVLQATSLSVRPNDPRGKVMVLDMGQPVKIADLARQIIRLAGHKPDEDIKIIYTGLRPGEKLYEELFSEDDELIPADADGVRLAKSHTVELTHLQQILSNFALQLQSGITEQAAIAKLKEFVPEFNHKP